MTERKEPLLLTEKVYCECGEKVAVIKTPFIAHTINITGICPKCKRLFVGDGKPDLKADGSPLYYEKGCGIKIHGMDYKVVK